MRSGEKISLSYDDVVAMFKAQGLTDENRWAQAVAKNFQKQENGEAADFVVSLGDDAVPENLKPVVAKWRNLAKSLSYDGPVCWRIRAGFTLKQHAPNVGPCYQKFQYLQNWNFKDESTGDAIVFWVPRLVPNSTSKTVPQQKKLLAGMRQEFGLPKTHLASFGGVGLLAALILAHHKATGERVLLDYYWVRTDTCSSDGGRLFFGDFGVRGLYCGYWDWDDERNPYVAVFALGVEALGLYDPWR